MNKIYNNVQLGTVEQTSEERLNVGLTSSTEAGPTAEATASTARRPARAVLARVRALARYVPALAALVARPGATALTSSTCAQI